MSDHLILRRLSDDGVATIGELRRADGSHLCWTLENTWANNERRVSCIPPGVYPLTVRTFGGWHERLAKRFPQIHKGAIELEGVPGRSAILIHPGNFHTETEGCVLPGDTRGIGPDGSLAVMSSGPAYVRIYPRLVDLANIGGFIRVRDERERTHAGTAI